MVNPNAYSARNSIPQVLAKSLYAIEADHDQADDQERDLALADHDAIENLKHVDRWGKHEHVNHGRYQHQKQQLVFELLEQKRR